MVVQVSLEGNAIYKDESAPIHTCNVVTKSHGKHSNETEHLVWPQQSQDLDILKHLWFTLEK